MDLTPVKVIGHILQHHGVSMCVTGELALNYYNVPRVCHDLEIFVPESSLLIATGLLCSTGLFASCDVDICFNNFTEYKRGFPRIQTTGWILPPQAIVIFPDSFYGLDLIEEAPVRPACYQRFHVSKEMAHLKRQDIANLRLPRLAPFLEGLARRFLTSKDDMAMIAVEQLVDGMNLDLDWAMKHLADSDPAILELVTRQIATKKARIDYVSDNVVTCFVVDEKEAQEIRLIAGFE